MADGLLVVLDQTVSIDGGGDRAVAVEGDTCRGTVGIPRASNVFLQFFFGVVLDFLVLFFVLETESYRCFMFVCDNMVVR